MWDEKNGGGLGEGASWTEAYARSVFSANAADHNSSLHSSLHLTSIREGTSARRRMQLEDTAEREGGVNDISGVI